MELDALVVKRLLAGLAHPLLPGTQALEVVTSLWTLQMQKSVTPRGWLGPAPSPALGLLPAPSDNHLRIHYGGEDAHLTYIGTWLFQSALHNLCMARGSTAPTEGGFGPKRYVHHTVTHLPRCRTARTQCAPPSVVVA